MAEIKIIDCSTEDIQKYREKYNLKEIKYDSDYDLILIEDVPRALIDVSSAKYYPGWDDVVSINAFEVFEKNKGFGSIIMKELEDEKIVLIPGNSGALRFWERHGFKKFDCENYINFSLE